MLPIAYLSPQTKLGIALILLKSKPPSLTLSEYISLLRSHTTLGTRPLGNGFEARFIDTSEFWRERAESEASKVFDLQAKIAELEEINRRLSKREAENGKEAAEAFKKSSNKKGKEGPVRKKRKKEGNGAGATASDEANKKEQTKTREIVTVENETDLETEFAPLASPTYNLLSSLRLLHFAQNSHLLSTAICRTCRGLSEVVRHSVHEDHVKSLTFANRVQASMNKSPKTREEKETSDLYEAIEKTCTKLLSALSVLGKSDCQGDGTSQFTADAIVEIIDLFKNMLFSIHENTRALLLAFLKPSHTKDLRLGIMNTLTRALKSLHAEVKHEGRVLEGTIYYLLEFLGKCLHPRAAGELEISTGEQRFMEKIALEESSWYFLRIFEAVLPEYYRCTANMDKEDGKNVPGEQRDLGKKGRERLKKALLRGVFGGNDLGVAENEKLASGGSAMLVESAMTSELWGMLGMEIFADG